MALRAGDLARRVGGAIGIAAEGVKMAAVVLAAGALAFALGWHEAGGVVILCGLAIAAFFRDPERSPVPACERLVLSGAAPQLAAFYPSAAGDPMPGDAWPAFRATVEANVDELRELIERPVQTNEVGRSASLLGGFLTVAAETRLPLRIFEIGASAGLNLRWDRYRYESGSWAWGDPYSPLTLHRIFESSTPEPTQLEVVERAGCDQAPIDPTTGDGTLTLMSYTWPDQVNRFEQMAGALRVAALFPAIVQEADAPSWLEPRLARPPSGVATVVYHSHVQQYLGDEGRTRLRAVIEDAGSRFSTEAPLAWLRLEPENPEGSGRFLVQLTTWPDGRERLLAESHPHGPPVRWLA